MSLEKSLAIVLKLVEFSETSSVVTLFTRDFGKVRAMAKGARRPKGPFESALDLLGVCRIVFLRKSSEALDLLTEAKLERRFRPADGDLSRLYAAYYVAELLNELTDDYDPHPELFDAADATLSALRAAPDVAELTLRFEVSALRLLGHFPSLEACVECGAAVPSAGRVPFTPAAGGVLCANCRIGKKQVIAVSAGVLVALSQLGAEADGLAERGAADGSPSDARQCAAIEPRALGELRGVMNHYVTHLLGHPPRMQRYLKAATENKPPEPDHG